jgi:soluble lytic murein transglycosylase-like protein
MKLRKVFEKYGMQAVQDAVAAYNAGSVRRASSGEYVNQRYVTKVMRYYGDLAGEGG